MVRGQPRLRSVHRERAGRVIEPRNETESRGPSWFSERTAAPRCRKSPGTEAPPGSKSTACTHGGSPGTWEILSSPSLRSGSGAPYNKSPGPRRRRARHACGSEEDERAMVPPSEGNEARREGRQEVGALHSTDEAGEPTRGTLRREGEPGYGTVGGKDAGNTEPRKRLNETAADSGTGEASAEHGAHDARPSHRRGACSGRPTGGPARTAHRAWIDGQTATEYAAEPGGEPPGRCSIASSRARTGHRRCERVHIPKGDGSKTAAHRHTDLRGQGPAAGGGDGAGGRLRAGLSGLLVRLPTEPVGAPSAGRPLEDD